MSRIFRQKYTRTLPTGGETTTRKGKRFARIAGQWYPVNATATRYTVTTETWYAEYRDAKGRLLVESTSCTDKDAARAVLTAKCRRVELTRAGVLTEQAAGAAGHADTPLQDHLDAWLESMLAGGRSDGYRRCCRTAMKKLGTSCGWTRLVDLTYDSFDKYLRDAGPRRIVAKKRLGLSARARNYYREILVAFCSWCVETGRLAANPLASYPVANLAADPQRPRRAFTDDELTRLLEAAYRRRPSRALVYRVLVLTGLRVSELRSLRVRHFRDGLLLLSAASEKARRGATLPVRADLAALLTAHVADKLPDEPLIEMPKKLTKRLDGDMKAAKIEKRDASGRTLDVHSLRHTFATSLARAGVAPRVAMELLRHSSMHLTMKVYTDPTLLARVEAVESLPALK